MGEGRGGVVEFGSFALTPARIDAEAVSGESGEDVEMNVEDLLEGGLSVGQEDVEPSHRKSVRRSARARRWPTRHMCIPSSSSRSINPTA